MKFWRMAQHTSYKIYFRTLTTALRSFNKSDNDGNETTKMKLIQIKSIKEKGNIISSGGLLPHLAKWLLCLIV